MGIAGGPNILGDENLVFIYDIADTDNCYLGEPTTNYVPGTYSYGLYAYASGPVDTVVYDEFGVYITAKRYTITQAVNTARAAIFPTSMSTGVKYTFSFKWKYNGTTTASPSIAVDSSKGNPEGNGSNSINFSNVSTSPIGNGWYLTIYTFSFSSSPTSACILTFGINTGATSTYINETFDVYEAQFEIKDYKTPYVLGTRSVSGSLFDLGANRKTITLTNSYTSTGQITFDGTDDFMNVGNLGTIGNAYSIECVFNSSDIVSYRNVCDMNYSTYNPNTGNVGPRLEQVTGNTIYWIWSGNTTNNNLYNFTSAASIAPNKYYHTVFTLNNGTVNTYLNGVISNLNASSAQGYITSFGDLKIGRGFVLDPSRYFSGQIPIVKIYNKALSASEVYNNYIIQKARFGL
jgi:hypothetical protein